MVQVIAAVCAVLLALCSQQTMQAAGAAAEAFVSGVMPALFPIMVLGRLLPAGGGAAAAALPGLLSGSPAAAQRLRMLQDGGLPLHRAERLAALTGVMSPLFFTGTLARWTGSARSGWMLLAVHWAAAGLTALVWRPERGGQAQPAAPPQPGRREPFLRRLPGAIVQAVQALMAVLGAMMLFSIAAALVRTGLERLCPAWAQPRSMAVLWALMEIGGGAAAVVQAWDEAPLALLAALCSFGGLSLWMQNLLFVGESIRPARLLGMRMLHGAIAYGLGLMLF